MGQSTTHAHLGQQTLWTTIRLQVNRSLEINEFNDWQINTGTSPDRCLYAFLSQQEMEVSMQSLCAFSHLEKHTFSGERRCKRHAFHCQTWCARRSSTIASGLQRNLAVAPERISATLSSFSSGGPQSARLGVNQSEPSILS